MLPRIKAILSVEPYAITCLWNTGEVRQIDFRQYLLDAKPHSPIARLVDKGLFSQVRTDGRTLYWDNMLIMIDLDGSQHPAPLDFDPDVMYQNSLLLSYTN